MTVVLDNTVPEKYDDRNANSFFGKISWYNRPISYTENESIVWEGTIKNLTINEKAGTITVVSSNIIRDMSKTICDGDYSGVVPAEAIFNIITDTSGLNYSEDYIDLDSYYRVKAIQEAGSAEVKCSFSSSQNQNVLSVISELNRISQMFTYVVNNRVYFYQWQPWEGQTGVRIYDHNIIAGSYNQYYDDK
jgi:hypothetical protein